MRLSSATLYLLALPNIAGAVVAAQDQIPLFEKAKGWFEQAASFARSAAAAGRNAAASNVAEHATTEITWHNWKSTLRHSGAAKPRDQPEAWMVYVTGGNKTCHGRCGRADIAWKEAVSYLIIDPSAPNLGNIDCEKEQILCAAWGSRIPSVWFFLLPLPQPTYDSAPSTPINLFSLNLTAVTSADITNIHTRKLYLDAPKYEGALHPFDGWVAKYNLAEPMAYSLYYLSMIPSWAFLIAVSMGSRYFVNKRTPPPGSRPRPNPPSAATGAS